MIDQSTLQAMAHWGYTLLPKRHPCSPGYAGLLVAMRERPTGTHYDPEWLALHVAEQSSGWTTLKLHSMTQGTRRVLAGRVLMGDRYDKRIEFFTFGASLEVDDRPHETVYALRSPAPLLEVTGDANNTASQVAWQAEQLIARLQAQFPTQDEGATRRLADIDPCALYQTSLEALLDHYDRVAMKRERCRGVYVTLRQERDWLTTNGQWRTFSAPPEERFSLN